MSALPWKSSPPDFVITFKIPPVARPNSGRYEAVWSWMSWIASKFRFSVKVCVTGSVVLTPSIKYEFSSRFPPATLELPVPTTIGACCAIVK